MDNPDRPASEQPESAPAIEVIDGKTERIASMRHELANVQRQLVEAQQRLTVELQGRAEDADRLEALEASLREHEGRASDGSARLAELTNQNTALFTRAELAEKAVEELRQELAARDARLAEVSAKHGELTEQSSAKHGELTEQLAAITAARDAELAHRTRLEAELEAAQGQAREAAATAETHAASLRDAKERVLDRESALAKVTGDFEALQAAKTRLESDLEEAKRAFETGRGKAQQLANKLASFSTEMLDTIVVPDPRPPRPSSKPPPIPGQSARLPSAAAPGEAHDLPTLPVVAIEAAKPAPVGAFAAVLALAGLVVGVAITVAVVKLTADTSPAATSPSDVVSAPGPAAAAAPVERREPIAHSQPEWVLGDAGAGAQAAASAPPADVRRVGIIVLPASADGHRVFVDGHRIEPKNSRIEVLCGQHEVKIGSEGEPQSLQVSCDGETILGNP